MLTLARMRVLRINSVRCLHGGPDWLGLQNALNPFRRLIDPDDFVLDRCDVGVDVGADLLGHQRGDDADIGCWILLSELYDRGMAVLGEVITQRFAEGFAQLIAATYRPSLSKVYFPLQNVHYRHDCVLVLPQPQIADDPCRDRLP